MRGGPGGLGIAVDGARSREATRPAPPGVTISPDGAAVAVLVVPTDEELEIALEAAAAGLRR